MTTVGEFKPLFAFRGQVPQVGVIAALGNATCPILVEPYQFDATPALFVFARWCALTCQDLWAPVDPEILPAMLSPAPEGHAAICTVLGAARSKAEGARRSAINSAHAALSCEKRPAAYAFVAAFHAKQALLHGGFFNPRQVDTQQTIVLGSLLLMQQFIQTARAADPQSLTAFWLVYELDRLLGAGKGADGEPG